MFRENCDIKIKMKAEGSEHTSHHFVESFLDGFPPDPLAPNYHNARKLKAALCLEKGSHDEAAFHFSEATAAALRTMALYRHEQISLNSGDSFELKKHLLPVDRMEKDQHLESRDKKLYPFLEKHIKEMKSKIKEPKTLTEIEPFHRTYLRFGHQNNVDNFKKILNDLPQEWTIIQLTAPYNPYETLKSLKQHQAELDSLYISVLRDAYTEAVGTGPINMELPANVTKDGETPLMKELYSLLECNVETMESASRYTQRNLHLYWQKRQDVDLRIASVIKIMDTEWLGGSKCCLTGKLQDKQLTRKIINLVETTIEDWGFVRFTPLQKVLLCKLLENVHHIQSSEIRSTLQRILTLFPNMEEARTLLEASKCEGCENAKISDACVKCRAGIFQSVHNFSLVDGIKAFMGAAKLVKNEPEWDELKSAKRHPVVIIVDEILDTFPWESIRILAGHPVTRVESIHLLYHLYKTHEKDIEDGYYTVKRQPVVGKYVINPAANLERMCKRMCGFVSYWCPHWDGDTGKPPEPNDFLRYLTTSDLFLYCGHGDGCQYASGAGAGCGVEAGAATGLRATALLSGCGSVRLQKAGGRTPPLASHYHYHIAGSPLVIGMLWEVSDLEVDKIVTTLLALAVPSEAPLPWDVVGKAQWSQGELDLNVEKRPSKLGTEPDVLRAVAKARHASNQHVISSSVVARGLPVRIQPLNK